MVNQIPANQGIEILEGLFGKGNQTGGAFTTNERNLQLQYWKNCSGCQVHTEQLGWIVVAPAMGELSTQDYYVQLNHKHRTSLEKYGKWIVGSSPKNNGIDLTIPEHRFDALILNEGIHEMPLDQMIAYNFHRNPVMVKYFPALADVVDYGCEYCNKLFNNQDGLRKHIRIWHSDVAQPKAIGQEISKAIEAVSGKATIDIEAAKAIAIAVAQALKESKE